MIFGDLANMGEMLKKVKDIQSNLKKVHKELEEETYESNVEGVRCAVSGDMELKAFKIDPEAFKRSDLPRLEKAVMEAVSSAMHEAKSVAKDKLKRVTGGISIPGLF